MMDPKSKEMLDEILAKEPAALTDSDKGFLRSRRSYLNEEQRTVYAEILADVPDAPEDLSTMSLAKLKKLAKERELDFDKNTTQEELVALLSEAPAVEPA